VIAIVDYGLGNLGSVVKAFRHLDVPVALTADRDALRSASALVLPGDGAFGAAMQELRERSLVPILLEAEAAGKPILGICVGMQLFFDESEEHGTHAGLGLLRGRVRRFGAALPVPHMGWNRLRWRRSHPVRGSVPEGAHVYFVHSYYAEAAPEDIVATSDYGVDFPAIVARRSLVGMQFHPEKSQAIGLSLIEAFMGIVHERRTGRVASRVVR
jgi:glutamine amidotransferase